MGGGVLVRSFDLKRLPDRLVNFVRSSEDSRVPEPQHAKALLAQPGVPRGVVRALVEMMRTVDFDDQAGAEADEVEDVAAHRYLPAELVAGEVAQAERAPKTALGVGGLAAEITCASGAIQLWSGIGVRAPQEPPTPTLPREGGGGRKGELSER